MNARCGARHCFPLLVIVFSVGVPSNAAMAATCSPLSDQDQSIYPATSLARAVFATKLLASVSADGRQNAAVSPFGVETVLGHLHLISGATMRRAIDNALQIGRDDDSATEALRGNARHLASDDIRAHGGFAGASALFIDGSLPVEQAMLERLGAEPGLMVRSVDFRSEKDLAAANRWVAEQTRGTMTDLLSGDGQPSLMAVNAFHFRDCWRVAFDPRDTAPEPFHFPDGSEHARQMMQQEFPDLPYAQNEGFEAVELAFADDRFSLTVITVRNGDADDVGFSDAAGILAGKGWKKGSVRLLLPPFAMGMDVQLLDGLAGMGLAEGLASPYPFERLSPDIGLTSIRQRIVMQVREDGTEAAAATVASASRESADGGMPLSISFDQPFVYALRHRPTSAVMVIGYVADPQPGAFEEP